jgi:hypothetical protein
MPRTKRQPLKINPGDLVPIGQAHKYFGSGFSVSTIKRRIADGELIEGKHWLDTAPATAKYRRIHLYKPGIEAHLSLPAGAR